MPFPKRQAAIVGVYTTRQGKLPDRTSFSLQLEAIKGALDDAGLTTAAIDGLLPMSGTDHMPGTSAHQFWAEQLGERPLGLVETGGASGQLAKAAASIAAGLTDVAVLFFGRAGARTGPGGTAVPDRAPRVADDWSFATAGGYMTSWYAMWAQRYMHEFGVTGDDLAGVAVHPLPRHAQPGLGHGQQGRDHRRRRAGLALRVRAAAPAGLLDRQRRRLRGRDRLGRGGSRLPPQPVWVLGGAEAYYTDFYATINDPWFPNEGKAVRKATDRAFGLAGIGRDEIDVAGLYDCFTVTTLRDLEEMGFCSSARAPTTCRRATCAWAARCPTNTDGGLLSNSHCGDPSGMHTIEVVRQLRGECGARQVPGARIGVSLQQGWAVHGLASTLVMAVDAKGEPQT